MRRINLFLLIMLVVIPVFCSQAAAVEPEKSDSLSDKLQQAKSDGDRFKIYAELAESHWSSDAILALEYARKTLLYVDGDSNRLAKAHYLLGTAYDLISIYKESIEYYELALEVYEKLGKHERSATVLSDLGNVQFAQGNFDEAFDYFQRAIVLLEEKKSDPAVRADIFSDIARLYWRLNKVEKAFELLQNALQIYQAQNDQLQTGNTLNNIGILQMVQGNHDKAMEKFESALNLFEKIAHPRGIAESLSNMAQVHSHKGNNDKSLELLTKSCALIEKQGDQVTLAYSYLNLGNEYQNSGFPTERLVYYQKALEIANTIQSSELTKEVYLNLSTAYLDLDDYREAMKYHQLYSAYKDSIFDQESVKRLAEMEALYESEKQSRKIEKLTSEKKLRGLELAKSKADLEKKGVQRNGLIIGSILLLLIGLMLLRSFLIKKRSNVVLQAKNIEIEKQRSKIIDSINYAKIIQQSILADESEIGKTFDDLFIFYQPKDIVSGDFYWFAEREDLDILAAVDCTGHGVPGALMSMIGNTLLSELVNGRKLVQASEILEELHVEVLKVLKRGKENTHTEDGMDIAICCIDRKNNVLEYAGARNHLFIVNEGKGRLVKATQRSIGGRKSKKAGATLPQFLSHRIELNKRDWFYLFTDGYMDQFGGAENERFGSAAFLELLENISGETAAIQKQKLKEQLDSWNQDNNQVDDILIVGFNA
jgi:tetratricopeptide (TPR) repeat protein